jgi:ubiquinone/menaquinone biosynthesis C-methylase UbiE
MEAMAEFVSNINGVEVILCQRQPGSLKITKRSCALRYMQAKEECMKVPKDEFDLIRAHSLQICGNCPEGKRFAKELSKAQRVTRKRKNG